MLQTVLTIIILLLAVAYAVSRIWKALKGPSHGQYGCAGCPLKDACKKPHNQHHSQDMCKNMPQAERKP